MDDLEAQIYTALADAQASGLDLSCPPTGARFMAAALAELQAEKRQKHKRPVVDCLRAALATIAEQNEVVTQ